jgi:hypothetical protein
VLAALKVNNHHMGSFMIKVIVIHVLFALVMLLGCNKDRQNDQPSSKQDGAKEGTTSTSQQHHQPERIYEPNGRETAQLDSLCKNIFNSYECAQTIEKFQLRHYAEYVTRKDGRLEISLKSGEVKVFKDTLSESYTDVAYSFRAYLKAIGYFLIAVQFYEGGGYLMINDNTGKEFFILDLPTISPSKQRLVSSSNYAEIEDSGIQIWRLTSNEMVLEWSIESADWGAKNAIWLDDKTISLTKVDYNFREVPITLKLGDKGWELLEQAHETGEMNN